jgi:hypothetical protein
MAYEKRGEASWFLDTMDALSVQDTTEELLTKALLSNGSTMGKAAPDDDLAIRALVDGLTRALPLMYDYKVDRCLVRWISLGQGT